MNINDTLRETRLNATRIKGFLEAAFNFEPGEDVDLDDSFRTAAKDLAELFTEIDRRMRRGDVPQEWQTKLPPPPPPLTREEQVAEIRAKATALGYRLVLHPPTKKKEP